MMLGNPPLTMNEDKPIILSRDCDAVLIPAGTLLSLTKGTSVLITQALGGSYTVNVHGNLARIDAKDADALGFEIKETNTTNEITGDGTVDQLLIWEQLRTCYDPEIPINIVELGLIYQCDVTPLGADGNQVDILLTLTSAGCGMGDYLAEDIRLKISAIENVTSVNVNLTFDPPWSFEMMSDLAKLETGMF